MTKKILKNLTLAQQFKIHLGAHYYVCHDILVHILCFREKMSERKETGTTITNLAASIKSNEELLCHKIIRSRGQRATTRVIQYTKVYTEVVAVFFFLSNNKVTKNEKFSTCVMCRRQMRGGWARSV